MSIMKEAHYEMRKDGESDKSFKKRFTTERSRQIDVYKRERLHFQGGWVFASEFCKPGCQLKPRDRRKLNFFITEHRGVLDKLNGIVNDL